jgi:hypothetical protein
MRCAKASLAFKNQPTDQRSASSTVAASLIVYETLPENDGATAREAHSLRLNRVEETPVVAPA